MSKFAICSCWIVGLALLLGGRDRADAQDADPAPAASVTEPAADPDAGPESEPASDPESEPDLVGPAAPIVEPPETPQGTLPWKRSTDSAAPLPVMRASSPKELLPNIEQSEFDSFFDGQSLPPTHETLLKILYRLPRFGQSNIERFQRPGVTLDQIATDPEKWRIQFVKIRGRVLRFSVTKLQAEVAALLEFRQFNLVEFQPDGADNPVLICTRNVPAAWQPDTDIDQRASAIGLFLQTGDESETPQLVFAADRIAWHPAAPNDALGVNEHLVVLGNLGMDISLFDAIKSRHGSRLGDRDMECFYQLLAAVKRSDPASFEARALPFDIRSLLGKPAENHGKIYRIRGAARRIIRIELTNEDLKRRTGLDHYYQIDVFVTLDKERIRLGKGDGPVFDNNFPVTLCVLDLPENLREIAGKLEASGTGSEMLNETVKMDGFFFKLWSYKSEYVSQFNERQRQVAPMFVGFRPSVVQFSMQHDMGTGFLFGGLFAGGVALVWFGVWYFNRSDSNFAKSKLKRGPEVDSGKSLNDLGIETPDEPDFSNLS